MTLVHLIIALVHYFYALGAHHAYATKQGHNGMIVTKNWLTLVCRIPQHLHGTYTCSGWVHRP